ncbi:MAG: NAD kinase [Bacteroidales bacterium]|nr:NAD kinase [Bacteroidales bacterium]
MYIAIFGKTFTDESLKYINQLIAKLNSINCKLMVYEPFYKLLENKVKFNGSLVLFNRHEEIKDIANFLVSIGGDGALLHTVTLVRDSGIPIIGINIGRLGFLSSIAKDEILPAIDSIINNEYFLDKRALIQLETKDDLFGNINYCLNEFSVKGKDSSSLSVIDVFIDGVLLNSYWADGLIIATPTGSTAYSLSCGGPIVTPGSENFLITPIATHNLTVRPIVIPDSCKIRIKLRGRNDKYVICLDSRSAIVNSSTELFIKKEKFGINLLKMKNQHFFHTIQNKLLWGVDIRN